MGVTALLGRVLSATVVSGQTSKPGPARGGRSRACLLTGLIPGRARPLDPTTSGTAIMPGRPDDGQRTGVAPYLYLFITMALFGVAFTSSKVVVGQLPHDVAAALRFGGGAVILVLVLCLRPGSTAFSWRDLTRAGLVGLIGVFAYNFFFFWGLSLAPAIDGSLIVPVLISVLTTIAVFATGGAKASLSRVIGFALGVAGAVVFFGDTECGRTGARVAVDLICLLGAAC